MTDDVYEHDTAPDGTGGRTRTVVVCGVGAVTAQGATATALWEGVRAGYSAIGPVRGMPMDFYGTDIGGEVQSELAPAYDYLAAFGGSEREPAVDFALAAAQEALDQADLGGVPAGRWGVSFGSCNGGLRSAEKLARRARPAAPPRTTAGTTCWCPRRPSPRRSAAPSASRGPRCR